MIQPLLRRLAVRSPLAVALILAAACASGGASSTQTATPLPSARPSAPITVSPTSPLKDFGTMWTFDAPPLQYWKARYQFDATPQWLDHVRLSAVRLPNCSASVVSANGLVMTNHHCARECVTSASTTDSSYNTTGFVAGTLNDEKRCPGMTADQLQSIEDVTARVQGAATSTDAATQAQQRGVTITRIQSDCASTTGMLCQVVTLYQGGRYSLYRFKRFTDLRLVFVPEEEVAFFGGDPDNFTYPRYDLDVALLRIYDRDAPLKPQNFLKWSARGAVEDEAAFVVGNPGSTGRLNTMSQLMFLRDVQYPNNLDQLRRQTAALRTLVSSGGEAARRRYEDAIFSFENSIKAIAGYRSGLLDSALMARKATFERDFRTRVDGNSEMRTRYGGAWDAIAAANRERTSFAIQTRFHGTGGSQLLGLMLQLVRIPGEEARPDSLRLPAFRGAGLATLKGAVTRAAPIDLAQEQALLTAQWEAAVAMLPPEDPFLTSALGGAAPAAAVRALFAGTKMADAAAGRRCSTAVPPRLPRAPTPWSFSPAPSIR